MVEQAVSMWHNLCLVHNVMQVVLMKSCFMQVELVFHPVSGKASSGSCKFQTTSPLHTYGIIRWACHFLGACMSQQVCISMPQCR